jgi:hypothetical protein
MMGFIRYRNIIDPLNGPISKVTAWQQKHPLLGDYFESVASLLPELCPPKSTDIYAHGAGGGASKSKITAVHKAISEALERWAFFHVSLNETNQKTILRLDTDPTSTGFACHPSYISCATRKKSHEEAVERWSIYNWWSQRISDVPHLAARETESASRQRAAIIALCRTRQTPFFREHRRSDINTMVGIYAPVLFGGVGENR